MTWPNFFRYAQTTAAVWRLSSLPFGRAWVDVGRKIRERRLRRGLVIEELARKTGLSKAYISQIETGKASPSLSTAEKLAQALDVPLT